MKAKFKSSSFFVCLCVSFVSIANQRDFAKSIFALGKTVVLLVLNGGSVDIGPELAAADSALEAFYPGDFNRKPKLRRPFSLIHSQN